MKFLILILLLVSSVQAKTLEVMSYNVENLFDAQHDEGKNDWTYMAKNAKGKKEACKKVSSNYRRKECLGTDWTEKKVQLKLSQIKKVILSKERGRLPEILGLVEIENKNVIKKLAKVLGYKKLVVSDSPDRRGVDLAVLWKESKELKFIAKREHIVKGDYFKKRPTRNILEVEFLIDGKYPLFTFVNHWPSLGNPDDARVVAATLLKGRISEIAKKVKNYNIVAMGDFNTIPKLKKKGNKHPLNDVFLKNSPMFDMLTAFNSSKSVAKSAKDKLPPGTYFYKRGNQWNQLDRFFLSKGLVDGKGLEAELGSYSVYAPSFIRKTFDKKHENKKSKSKLPAPPFRYNHQASKVKKAGYSDHFPIVFNLKF
ncbi:MAG: hypothetical protein BM556_02450 [Bacteriovorax sp. MedPE-SWde]|nr:MAG: hypothetical protein BM556_02450 [Bacteriovorax sp. MedPE-SWde]